MRKDHLELLRCTACGGTALELEGAPDARGRVKEGRLGCPCGRSFPVRNYVPRFIEGNPYADTFGPQWRAFATSQLDDAELQESAVRFDSEIGWGETELRGAVIVEFGSGAGRFIDVVSRRGARLCVGLDATDAVDASQDNLGERDNVLFVQGDIFDSPLRPEAFTHAYSIGVLHHTPDPEEGFRRMVTLLREGGWAGVSLYENSYFDRPNRTSAAVAAKDLAWAANTLRVELFRSVTTRLPTPIMLAWCRKVVPVLHEVNKVPGLRYARYLVPSTCYRDLPAIHSMVDTHDTYATKIIHQYRGRDLFQWFLREGLSEVILHNSRAGWVSVTGRKGSPQERAEVRRRWSRPPAPPIGQR